MTIVARLQIPGSPMLIGDMLLSWPAEWGVRGSLPTIQNLEDVSAEFPAGVPCGTSQKVAVLGPDLAVGWAGPRHLIERVVRELRCAAERAPFSIESLREHLGQLPDETWQELELSCLLYDASGGHAFQIGGSNFNLDGVGVVGLIGSGQIPVANRLREIGMLPRSRDLELNPLQASIGLALTLTGTLLLSEINWADTLASRFGGGYEIVYRTDGRFQKLDDVTYLFWTASVDGNLVRIEHSPRQVFRYAYRDDLLIIRSAWLEANENGSYSVRSGMFSVPPVYRDVEPSELDEIEAPPFRALWLCNYFLVSFSDGTQAILHLMRYQPNEETWIRFQENTQSIEVAISQVFLEEVAREILRRTGVIDDLPP